MPQINQAGLDLIKSFEGLRLQAYADSGGVWTIGYGHTNGVEKGQTITEQQADEFLREDVEWAEKAVSDVVQVTLTPNQFAALVSFVFNVGNVAFADSTLLACVNRQNFAGAADQFQRWTYAGSLYLPGLARRREAEKALFLKP
jgi:lysozyme